MSLSGCNSQLDALLAAEEEVGQEPTAPAASGGVSVSVDGKPTIGQRQVEDPVVITDNALEDVDIQLKFDGLDLTRRLNVSTDDIRRTYRPGEQVRFVGSWNYPQWVEHAEVRIFRQADKYSTEAIAKPVEVLPMPLTGGGTSSVVWQGAQPAGNERTIDEHLTYVLRVYDNKGRFDETLPLNLKISETDVAVEDRIGTIPAIPGEGEDRTGVSNIPLYGGSLTVHGKHIPPGYTVSVLGEEIQLDDDQKFVVSRILPPGDHQVNVKVHGPGKDSGIELERDLNIPDSEWFYVGLADITVGQRLGRHAEKLAQAYPGEFDETYERGRVAFYLKGKIKGETLITAAFDTTEDDLDELFRDLNERDPRQLLRNLDPDDFYPVYGDDSTIVEDAPTSGKFYVRVERGKSHVLWGNYKTRINETELTRFERGLYGGRAVLKTPQTTEHGESVAKVEAFAAEPGSIPQRDEFRATGGSAYFLNRQAINEGSEQITIEERDRVTGEVVSRTLLRADEDYEIDYVQGVLLLRRPLQSTTGTDSAVRQSVLGGNETFLIAVYEFSPAQTELDGLVYGGRVEQWVSDTVRIGASGFQDDTAFADQTLYGADVLIRLSEKSYVQFEWAESDGDAFGASTSTDGGLIFNPVSGASTANGRAQALRAQAAIDLGEATGGAIEGTLGGFYEDRDAGFNAPGRYTPIDERLAGAHLDVKITDETKIRAAWEQARRGDGNDLEQASAEIRQAFGDKYAVTVGATHSDASKPVGSSTGIGERVDLGVRLDASLNDGSNAWVFGQTTVSRDATRERNDRIGVGIEKDLTDKITASGEVSYGTQGIGGLAALSYSPNADDRYYLGYRLDPDTTAGDLNGYDPFGRDFGSIVFGANRRVNDQLTAFFEENFDFTGTQRSLTHTYGVNYTPDDRWTVGAGLEAGEILDEINGDFDRFAVSGTLSLREEIQTASVRLEGRFEDSNFDDTRDRDTFLLAANYGKTYDDWRFIAKIDALISQSDQTAILDGDYVEGSVGWAYRPVDDDRLNALFRYTYLEDLPGPQQVTVQGELLGPRQRSHVLEADFVYDLTERLSVGGKYGFRIGEIAVDRASDDFVDSSAHLAVARADYHLVDKWDLLLEGRALWLSEVEQVNYGALAGLYYHIGENAKIGVGYNFGRFSDDITDFVHDDQGVFINLIGKF